MDYALKRIVPLEKFDSLISRGIVKPSIIDKPKIAEFLGTCRSAACRLEIPTPPTIAIPNSQRPPINGSGMLAITAANFVHIPSKIIIAPAICNTLRLATLVISMAPMFFAYVEKLLPPPKNPPMNEQKPSMKIPRFTA